MKYLVEIDDNLIEQLHLMAGQEGLSPNQYLEQAVKQGLERAKIINKITNKDKEKNNKLFDTDNRKIS